MPLSREAFQMLLRRKFALAVCATVITAPVLSSCGFGYATDKPYTPAAGTNNRDADVDVLNAVIVAGQDDRGTLVAGLANNKAEPITVSGITGEGLTVEFDSAEVPPGGFLNLADEDVHVEGDFKAGNVLDMSVDFGNGDQVDLEVPVVTDCDEFAGFDTSVAAGAGAGSTSDESAYSCEYAESESGH